MYKEPISKCCKRPLRVAGGQEGTFHFVCIKCRKPADIYSGDKELVNQPPPEKQEKKTFDEYIEETLKDKPELRKKLEAEERELDLVEVACELCGVTHTHIRTEQPHQEKQEVAHACAEGTCSIKVPVPPHQDEGMFWDKVMDILRIEDLTMKEVAHRIDDLHNSFLAKDRQQLREAIDIKKLICSECFNNWYECTHTKLPLAQLTKTTTALLSKQKTIK